MNHNKYVIFSSSLQWREKPLLPFLDIELTERCNNKCLHCCINRPADDQAAIGAELPLEIWYDVLRQAVDLGAMTVRFTGGEPLLHPAFVDIYLFARRLGLRVILFTNGRLITKELANLFQRIPPLDKLELTVYGMSSASYDSSTRIYGSFDEYRQGLQLLLDHKIPFIVKGALLPTNSHEMEEFISWSSNIPWMESGPSLSMFFELRGRRDSVEKNNLIKKLRLSPRQGMKVLTIQPSEYRKSMYHFCRMFLNQPSDQIFTCNYDRRICIDAYGKIQFCLGLRHPDTVIDIREQTFKYALSEFFPKLIMKKSKNPDYLARCGQCFLKGLCEQCPAKSWSEHGVLDQPVDYLCEIAHEQARYLGLLSDGELAWDVKKWPERIKNMKESA